MYPSHDNTQTTRRPLINGFAPTNGFNPQKQNMQQQTGLTNNNSIKSTIPHRSAFAPAQQRVINTRQQPQPQSSVFQQPKQQSSSQQPQLIKKFTQPPLQQSHQGPELHKLPTTIQQQHIQQPSQQQQQQAQQQQQSYSYRTSTEEYNDDNNGLVQLPIPSLQFDDDDDVSIAKSFHLNLQAVVGAQDGTIQVNGTPYDEEQQTLDELQAEFDSITLQQSYKTDYNDLTSLSTYPDQISIISIPVNCFSIATNGSLHNNDVKFGKTPEQTLVHQKEVQTLRSTVSFIRHQMLSSLHANPTQVLESTQQLMQYIDIYNKRKPIYNVELFDTQLTNTRAIAVDYMWRTASKEQMSFETYCNGMHILDRVLSLPTIIQHRETSDIQLSTLNSLYLAYKMIEKRIAAASTISGSLGISRFPVADIARHEQTILNALSFNVAPASLYDIVGQLALIFASTRQRDTYFENRAETDDLSTKSGRYMRLQSFLKFLTICTLSKPEYLKFTGIGLSCAIMMVALAAINTDFTQVWPISMAMITGIVPDDVIEEIKYVVNCHQYVMTTTNGRNILIFNNAIEHFGDQKSYQVSRWRFDMKMIDERIEATKIECQKFIQHYNINFTMLSRLSGIQSSLLRVGAILESRTITRKQSTNIVKNSFQSPIRNSNSNIIPKHQKSPILQKEQDMLASLCGSHTNTEYKVAVYVDITLQNRLNPRTIGTTSYSMEQSLFGKNPICLKIWMSEDSICSLEGGDEIFYQWKQSQLQLYQPKTIPQQIRPIQQQPPVQMKSTYNGTNNTMQTPPNVRKQPPTQIDDLMSAMQSPKQLLPQRTAVNVNKMNNTKEAEQLRHEMRLNEHYQNNIKQQQIQSQSNGEQPQLIKQSSNDSKSRKKGQENPNSCNIM